LVSDIPAGDGKNENPFLQCTECFGFSSAMQGVHGLDQFYEEKKITMSLSKARINVNHINKNKCFFFIQNKCVLKTLSNGVDQITVCSSPMARKGARIPLTSSILMPAKPEKEELVVQIASRKGGKW
jgi:hypothetical protein